MTITQTSNRGTRWAAGRTFGIALGIFLGIAVAASTPALAQSNLPYQPGGGTGLSLGARQAIINDRLFNSRPNVLLRSPSGLLFGIRRENSQALLQSPEGGAFLPGARPNSAWPTGLGTALGWGGGSTGGGLYAGPGAAGVSGSSLPGWIAMLPTGGGASDGGGLFFGNTATPIDSWIRQLELI
jgi:hypothetical protein